MHYLIVFAFGFTVLCRATHMDEHTHLVDRLQYWVPLVLVSASLPVFGFTAYAPELLSAAACSILWIARKQPSCFGNTTLPRIDERELPHVSGGSRD